MHDLRFIVNIGLQNLKKFWGRIILEHFRSSVETIKFRMRISLSVRVVQAKLRSRAFLRRISVYLQMTYIEIDAASNRGIEDIKNFATAREFYL